MGEVRRGVGAFVGGWVGMIVLILVTVVALGASAYWWAPWKGRHRSARRSTTRPSGAR